MYDILACIRKGSLMNSVDRFRREVTTLIDEQMEDAGLPLTTDRTAPNSTAADRPVLLPQKTSSGCTSN